MIIQAAVDHMLHTGFDSCLVQSYAPVRLGLFAEREPIGVQEDTIGSTSGGFECLEIVALGGWIDCSLDVRELQKFLTLGRVGAASEEDDAEVTGGCEDSNNGRSLGAGAANDEDCLHVYWLCG